MQREKTFCKENDTYVNMETVNNFQNNIRTNWENFYEVFPLGTEDAAFSGFKTVERHANMVPVVSVLRKIRLYFFQSSPPAKRGLED